MVRFESLWMKRDIAALCDETFDLVVIGAGVYGAAITWDAALRGLKVALIDKGDFGSGTSFNNLKTVHGGIRYLQHADLKRMRESVRERRSLMRIAPHLVHPLPFLVPTYRGQLKKGRAAMRVALVLNDIVSWDRNRLADPSKHLPAGRVLSRDECLELAPGIERDKLTGAVLWYDAQMHNSDRLTLSFVLSAAENGAKVANYVEATGFLTERGRVAGIVARDGLAATEGISIRGRVVVNAAGPWVDRVLSRGSGDARGSLFNFSKAMNLVTRPVVNDVALGVTSRRPHRDRDALLDTGGRFLCLIPWRSVSLIGTAHAPYTGEPDELQTSEEEILDLLEDVNDAYPEARLERSDVRLVHQGILPMVPGSSECEGVTLLKSYRIDERIEGLISVVGVKYTTARDVAERVVDHAAARLNCSSLRSRSASTPLVGGDIESFPDFLDAAQGSAPADVVRHLVYTYGSRYRRILDYADPRRIAEDSPVLETELRHAVREEMACDLESVILRRTELGTAGHPGRAVLEKAADIVRSELGWSDDRKASELERVESFYRNRS
jgi:glycerol-3-phosphate dehydrogenase